MINKNNKINQLVEVISSIVKSRFLTNYPRPVMLSHLVTEKCNAHCAFCFWKKPRKGELTFDEIKSLYSEAKDRGVVSAGLWGGEPLLRNDIIDIASAARQNFPLTVLYTNGYHLSDFDDIGKYVDIIFVSIDEIGDKHDKIRGLKGLFDRMVQGIIKVRKKYPNIKFMACCTLSKLNEGNINAVASWGKDMEVPIFFGPLFCADGATINAPGKDKVKKFDKTTQEYSYDFMQIKLLKKMGYPVANSPSYINYIIDGAGHYRCHWPEITLTIYSDGTVEDCRFYKGIGNVKQMPLKSIIESDEYKNFVSGAHECKFGCRGQDPVEASKMWDLDPRSIFNYLVMSL